MKNEMEKLNHENLRRMCFVLIIGILLKLSCVWICIHFGVLYGYFLRSDVLNSFSKRIKLTSTETTTVCPTRPSK